jgi:hypothetical protein
MNLIAETLDLFTDPELRDGLQIGVSVYARPQCSSREFGSRATPVVSTGSPSGVPVATALDDPSGSFSDFVAFWYVGGWLCCWLDCPEDCD